MTASPEVQRLAVRLSTAHPRVDEFVRAQLGIKTGANAVFLDPPQALERWCRPAIRGRDVRPFVAHPGSRMLWPADPRGVPWQRLPPAVAAYLDGHSNQLERRADHDGGPRWQLFRTRPATAEHRVIWRDLARQLEATMLPDQDPVPLNSCYVAAMRSAHAASAIAAWFNSTPIRALARIVAEPASGGCARFGTRVVGSLPLPPGVLADRVLAEFSERARHHNDQAALDQHVATVLELTAGELELLRAVASNRR